MKTLRNFILLVLVITVASVNVGANNNNNKVKNAAKASVETTAINAPVFAPEVQPRYIGGEQALFNFIKDNLRYPEDARNDKVEGKVTVRVVITETGQVRSARVVKGTGCYQCDQEALRIMYAMPNWAPGQVNGENVATYCTVPVTFTLN